MELERWNDPNKPSNMYLVLPSYTEPQKNTIKKLIADKKAKLCSNSLFKHVFASIDFRIAFANSKNIKKIDSENKSVNYFKRIFFWGFQGNIAWRLILWSWK